MAAQQYVDAALSAAAVRTGREDLAVEDLRFVAPLVVGPHDVPVLRVVVDEVTKRFTASSRGATGSAWTVNATGRLVEGPVRSRRIDLPAPTSPIRDGAELYPELATRGLEYGCAFRRIEKIQTGADFAVARIDTSIDEGCGHLAHPAALDTALQCVAALLEPGPGAGIVVPAGIRTVRRFGPIPRGTATVLVRRRDGGSLPLADIDVLDRDGRQVIAMSGVEFRSLTPPTPVVERLGTVFHEPQWSLCEPLTRCAERHPDEVAVVVAIGSSARRRAADLAHSHPNAVLVEAPASSEPADSVLAALDTELTRGSTGVVVVVAGAEAGAARNVHALARIAGRLAGIGSEPVRRSLRAVVVTEHAFCLPGSSADADHANAALVGARRSLLNEQPEFRWRLIDTESGTGTDELAREVWHGAGDDPVDEVCLRLGARWSLHLRQNLPEYLARLEEVRVVDGPETSFTLDVPGSHLFGDLAWRETERIVPADNEIEVRMDAVGLNPKDAFKVLGVLTETDMAETFFGTGLGLEGDGVIVRAGSHVHDVAVGDRVVVSAPDMIRRYVTIDRARATVVPSHWPVGTCSSTVPFLTAEFALIDVARLADGETVLVHGAAGGVGQAAIQVAKRLGATVIAAAGTDERRAHVLAAGADHAVDSRSLTLVDDVLRLTDGRGVDVVLNSVPGEMVRQNFRVAAEFGRIVDIGKIDIYTDGVIDLRPFDRNLTFAAFDLDRMLNFRPETVRARMTELVDRFDRGIYTHLDFRMHSVDAVAAAFDEVARPTRIGRVVLDLRTSSLELRPTIPSLLVASDATYLVTGGFGAFGLATARWLVRADARHLVLLGRNGPTTERARLQMRELRRRGRRRGARAYRRLRLRRRRRRDRTRRGGQRPVARGVPRRGCRRQPPRLCNHRGQRRSGLRAEARRCDQPGPRGARVRRRPRPLRAVVVGQCDRRRIPAGHPTVRRTPPWPPLRSTAEAAANRRCAWTGDRCPVAGWRRQTRRPCVTSRRSGCARSISTPRANTSVNCSDWGRHTCRSSTWTGSRRLPQPTRLRIRADSTSWRTAAIPRPTRRRRWRPRFSPCPSIGVPPPPARHSPTFSPSCWACRRPRSISIHPWPNSGSTR